MWSLGQAWEGLMWLLGQAWEKRLKNGWSVAFKVGYGELLGLVIVKWL